MPPPARCTDNAAMIAARRLSAPRARRARRPRRSTPPRRCRCRHEQLPDARKLLAQVRPARQEELGAELPRRRARLSRDRRRAARSATTTGSIEIGAGLGTLTARLGRRRRRKVIAIERDRDMVDDAARRARRATRASRSSRPTRSPSTTPRSPRAPDERRWSSATCRIRSRRRSCSACSRRARRIARIVVMLQKEMADRIVAAPDTKEYGALSVMVRMYGEPQARVPRARGRVRAGAAGRLGGAAHRAATPAARPGCRSTTSASRQVVHAAFGQRRKTLRNALSRGARRERGRPRAGARRASTACGAARRSPSRSSRALTERRQSMPELPEVETVARTLRPRLVGRAHRARSRPAGCRCGGRSIARALERACVGARVDGGAPRRQVSADRSVVAAHVLLAHLGMSGRLVFAAAADAARRRTPTRSSRSTAASSCATSIRAASACLRVYRAAERRRRRRSWRCSASIRSRPSFTVDYLAAALAASQRDVKAFLLDQRASPASATSMCARRCFAPSIAPRRRSHRLVERGRPRCTRRSSRGARARHRQPRHQLPRLRRRRRRSGGNQHTSPSMGAKRRALPRVRRRGASPGTGRAFHVFLPALPEVDADRPIDRRGCRVRRIESCRRFSYDRACRQLLATAAARGVGAGRLRRVADVAISRRRRARVRGAGHAPSQAHLQLHPALRARHGAGGGRDARDLPALIKGADAYERQAKFTTWLYTIARNLCVDAARRGKHRKAASLDAPVDDDDGSATLLDLVARRRRGGRSAGASSRELALRMRAGDRVAARRAARDFLVARSGRSTVQRDRRKWSAARRTR